MRAGFVESVADALLAEGTLARSDSVLAICAGKRERDLLADRGFTDVVISNLEPEADMAPFAWSRQDARELELDEALSTSASSSLDWRTRSRWSPSVPRAYGRG